MLTVRWTRSALLGAVLAAGLVGACSDAATPGGVTASATAGSGAGPATTTTAGAGGAKTDEAPPQVTDLAGGKPLAAPKVRLIMYAEDPVEGDVEKFLTELTHTSTWSEQTAEYGVGALTVLPTISIAGTPPATIDDNTGDTTPLQAMIASNTSSVTAPWGAADPSTIYLFVLPAGTQVNSMALCCDPTSGYFGYHYETPGDLPYAVVCNCPNFDMAPLTALQWVTTSVSHELVEAATNPHVVSSPAWSQADNGHAIWNVGTFGGEVADMCQDNADSNYIPPGSTYMVQRSWSNAAAKAGKNPCVPTPSTGAYFNAYPAFPDSVTLTGGTALPPAVTPGVKIAVGESRTIDILLASDGKTSGPWTIKAQDLTAFAGGAAATELSLDKTTGNEGDILHLTITVKSIDPGFGGEGFVLSSTLGGQNNLWFGAVGQ